MTSINSLIDGMDKLSVSHSSEETKNAITIQSWWRGVCLRKHFLKQEDNYSYEILLRCVDKYITDLQFNKDINKLLSKKKRRNEPFPSDISENIVKFVIAKKYGIMPKWDTEKNRGDLIINKKQLFKKVEVKGFMSSGPSSFGPKERWDLIYFVDAQDIVNKKFKVFEIILSNKNEVFRKIMLTKNQTYGDIADTGKRPRASFYEKFKPQLGENCKLIFDGHVSELNNFL